MTPDFPKRIKIYKRRNYRISFVSITDGGPSFNERFDISLRTRPARRILSAYRYHNPTDRYDHRRTRTIGTINPQVFPSNRYIEAFRAPMFE